MTACAGNNVVEHPIALNKVGPELMRDPPAARCSIPKRPAPASDGRIDARDLDNYGAALEKYANCWRSHYQAVATLARGLQAAVKVREDAADKALAAAKI